MALVRRYPCLYTDEAHKKPQNQRKLDGFVRVHHHNISTSLVNEDARTLKWSFLRAHPGRKHFENGQGGVTKQFRLKEDEEVVFGETHKAWITGAAVEESFQDLQGSAVDRERKRASVAAWRDEDQEEEQQEQPPRKRSRLSLPAHMSSPFASRPIASTSAKSSTPLASRVSTGAGAAQTGCSTATNAPQLVSKRPSHQGKATPLWRKSENVQIGVSPVAQLDGSAPKPEETSTPTPAPAYAEPSSRPIKPLPPHLRQTGTSSLGSPASIKSLSRQKSRTESPVSMKGVSQKLLKPFKPPSRRESL